MADGIQAQTADGVTHSFPAGTPDEVVDRAIKGYLSTKANGVDTDQLQNQTMQQSRQQLLKPLNQPNPIDQWQNRATPADTISKNLGNSIQKSDQTALQTGNPSAVASPVTRMAKSAIDMGRSAVQHPLLTAGVAAANTNPVTAVPVDAALAIHGGAGLYQHRQALKDFATTGNANPDELEAGLNSGAEMAGGVAGTAGNASAARAALRPSIPQQNTAIQKSLDPGWSKRESFQKSVEGARPYLGGQGVQGVSDLQRAIPGAQNEIWKPYSDALGRFGGEGVEGPNGPTTYNALEARRVELSNQLQKLHENDPITQQTVLAQGKTPAALAEEQGATEKLIDDRMQQEGLNSPLIRRTFGSVRGVERQVSGTNTLSEEPKRYGLGRMSQDAQLDIFHPIRSIRSTLGGISAGAQDIAAGRPLWQGKPTDVGVAEGLQSGAPKPDFRTTVARQPLGPQPMPPVFQPPPPAEQVPAGPGILPQHAAEGPPLWNPAVGDQHPNSLWKGTVPLPEAPNPSSPLYSGQHAVHQGSVQFGPNQPQTMPPPVQPKYATEATGTVQPIALGPGTGGPTYQGPLRPPSPPGRPALGPVAPPTQPPVPSNLTGAPAPTAPPAAPNVSAPQSNSAPPVLPPVPSSPINPAEVADYSKMLGRPVTAAEIPEIRARLDAERNVNTGLAGNRTDQVGNIRETHRATLTQPKRK